MHCTYPPDMGPWRSRDLNYALHVGMYSYAAGLERLCKLAIACNEYAACGEFPKNLKEYSHSIGTLLDAVEALVPAGPGASMRAKYLSRPLDDLDPDLMNMVERFAGGAGRYEHLDSLWKDDVEVKTYNDWSALAARASVSEEVSRLISTKDAIARVFESEMIDAGLEATMQSMMDELSLGTYKPSVGVVLSLFRTVRWVVSILDVATYYTREDLPILGEVVDPPFVHSSTSFFMYEITRIGDGEVVDDELAEAFTRLNMREAELDAEDFDEVGTEE